MALITDLLHSARTRLSPISDSPSGDAQVLLCHVLGVERAWLLAHPEHVLTPEQSALFEALVARCAAGEPLPYVLGRRAWYDRDFIVTPAVLIPRPETELLLEQALAWSNNHGGVAVDVGTGSGILAVTFAALRPAWAVHAVDVSQAALDVARRNAELHGVAERITFHQSDLLTTSPLSPLSILERGFRGEVLLLMANLPYIPSADAAALPVARHEPLLALDGGADGLDLIRRLLRQAQMRMRPDGLILLEIEARQGSAVMALANEAFPTAAVTVLRDYAGHDRIVRVDLVDGKDAVSIDS
jgi:release factor glutamine methyltransferase